MSDNTMNLQNISNNENDAFPYIPKWIAVSNCLLLAVIYVCSLYVWRNPHNRDHPETVKRRSLSVLVIMFIAPVVVYKVSSTELLEQVPFTTILGLKLEGLFLAIIVPLVLTMLLFLGPLCVQFQNQSPLNFFDVKYWKYCFTDGIWLRNIVIAPITEEFVYRGCLMPLILQSFAPVTAVFVTPLFFGVAHVHHIMERLSIGMDLKTSLVLSCFQMTYTTLFGFYTAYLFARTGHIIAPIIVHSFCNSMGLPDLQELWQQHTARRILFIILYFVGLFGWILLLPIATQPALYANRLWWNV